MDCTVFDVNGKIIAIGDEIIFLHASGELLNELPFMDREAIVAQISKKFIVQDFDDFGNAELEFTDDANGIHFIWVEPKYLLKIFVHDKKITY